MSRVPGGIVAFLKFVLIDTEEKPFAKPALQLTVFARSVTLRLEK
jgi:hypothetical protein